MIRPDFWDWGPDVDLYDLTFSEGGGAAESQTDGKIVALRNYAGRVQD